MGTSDSSQGGGGYGDPPKNTQFRPGESGNVKGRPPGALGFKRALKLALAENKTTASEFLVSALSEDVKRAKDGSDPKARDRVLRFIEKYFREGDES